MDICYVKLSSIYLFTNIIFRPVFHLACMAGGLSHVSRKTHGTPRNMSILIRICQHALMTVRSNKIIDLTGRFRRALAADWRMTCASFTSFYAFVKFVTTIHTTTCSIFKLYCSIFKQQKFCLYLHGVTLRVFLHTLQTAGDIIHLIIHHKLFHASCLYITWLRY
jgi:hypothetical protein